jgi:HEAT repeat protein
MQSDSHDLRLYAAAAVAAIDTKNQDALEVLLAGLRNDSVSTRHRAAGFLCELGPRAAPLQPKLEAMLLSDYDRIPAAAALLSIQPGHSQALAFFRTKLKEQAHVEMALMCLRLAGPAARSLVAEITDAGKNGNSYAHSLANYALQDIAPEMPRIKAP